MALDKFGRHIQRKDSFLDSFSDDEYIDVQYKRLINVAIPVSEYDAVNKEFLNNELNKITVTLDRHRGAASKNVSMANQIIKDIQININYLYETLNLTKPAPNPPVNIDNPTAQDVNKNEAADQLN